MKITILKNTDLEFKLVVRDASIIPQETDIKIITNSKDGYWMNCLLTFINTCLTIPEHAKDYYIFLNPTLHPSSGEVQSMDLILHSKLEIKSRFVPHYRLTLTQSERRIIANDIMHGEYIASILQSSYNSDPHIDIDDINFKNDITYYISHRNIEKICQELIDEIGYARWTANEKIDDIFLTDIPAYLYSYMISSPMHKKIGRYISAD